MRRAGGHLADRGQAVMDIATILTHIDSGYMALPKFQRGYVWNRDQVRGLMDSLYRRPRSAACSSIEFGDTLTYAEVAEFASLLAPGALAQGVGPPSTRLCSTAGGPLVEGPPQEWQAAHGDAAAAADRRERQRAGRTALSLRAADRSHVHDLCDQVSRRRESIQLAASGPNYLPSRILHDLDIM